MKKLILTLICLCFVSAFAFAGVKEMEEAFKEKDYITFISLAKEVIADVDASVRDKANAQIYIGVYYYGQRDYTKAISEFQKIIDNYPAEKYFGANAQRWIARCYNKQGDSVRAMSEFQKVIDNYPKERHQCAISLYSIGRYYNRAGNDTVKAQDAFCNLCANYSSTWDWKSAQKAYEEIDFSLLTDEKTVEVLNGIKKGIKNNIETAKFLGNVLSELEKYLK